MNDLVQFGSGGRTHTHANAVVGKDFQFFYIFVSLAGHYRMHAAGIISNHSAERTSAVRSGIGAESQIVFLGGIAQMIKNDPGLHASDAAFGIELDDFRHVLRKIEHHGDIAALPSQRRSASTAKYWSRVLPADGNCSDHIVRITWNYDSDGHLTIIGTIGGIKSAAAVVEPDLPTQVAAQS